MRLLRNLKIRTKVIIALSPLAIMVVITALYSSDHMRIIDARYRDLYDSDAKALQDLTLAQAHNNKFGLFLYKQIAELDSDRMRLIDSELDEMVTDFHTTMDEAKREIPNLSSEINRAATLFNEGVANSRQVRAATHAHQKDKAMKLMREVYDPQWSATRNAMIELQQAVHSRVNQQSAELTAKTNRMITTTWIVIILGLLISFAIALSIVQREVVDVMLSFRDRILDVAAGRLD